MTEKTINKAKKKMQQYVRLNIKQLKEVLEVVMVKGKKVKEKIEHIIGNILKFAPVL